MSEEQNIPEEQKPISNEQPAIVNENLQPESAEQQISNPKLETKNMEVHKHPHHVSHKKKWGEYLLEVLNLWITLPVDRVWQRRSLGIFCNNGF